MANLRNNSRRKKRPSNNKPQRGKRATTRTGAPRRRPRSTEVQEPRDDGKIRLNRFLSNCGVCSRREADVLIKAGAVTVNDQLVTELGVRIDPAADVVQYDGETIRMEEMRYVLLNKPKNYVTTMDDPQKRRTVMALMQGACKERIYPVGRLDRMTVGLLLFTNDGDMAKRLTHPKHGFPKLYHVHTAEKVKSTHMEMMKEGIKLDDGFIKADQVEFVGDGSDARSIGIEIHSGRNRIVRRIFEHFGYTITKLDRVKFGPLTKKDLPRGHYRHLTEQEVNFLKMVR